MLVCEEKGLIVKSIVLHADIDICIKISVRSERA